MRTLFFVLAFLIVLISGCADSGSKVTRPNDVNATDETSVRGDDDVNVDVGTDRGKLDVEVDAGGVSVEVGENGVSIDVADE